MKKSIKYEIAKYPFDKPGKSFTSIVDARKALKAVQAKLMDPSDAYVVKVETKDGKVTRTVVT